MRTAIHNVAPSNDNIDKAFADLERKRHAAVALEAPAAIDELCQAWDAFNIHLNKWLAIQETAYALTEEAVTIARRQNIDIPSLGTFQSERVSVICRDSQPLWSKLYPATEATQVVNTIQGRRLD